MEGTKFISFHFFVDLKLLMQPQSGFLFCFVSLHFRKYTYIYIFKDRYKGYTYVRTGIPDNDVSLELQFSSVQSLSHDWLFAIPWIAARQSSLPINNSQSLQKFTSIVLVMLSNHLILSCPLLLPSSIFPSIRVFSSELVLRIRWPKDWSFSQSQHQSLQWTPRTDPL